MFSRKGELYKQLKTEVNSQLSLIAKREMKFNCAVRGICIVLIVIAASLPWIERPGDYSYVFLFMTCDLWLFGANCTDAFSYSDTEYLNSVKLASFFMVISTFIAIFCCLLGICIRKAADFIAFAGYLAGVITWAVISPYQPRSENEASYGFSLSIVNSVVLFWILFHALYFRKLIIHNKPYL